MSATLVPNAAQALCLAAIQHRQAGQSEQAIAKCLAAVTLQPDHPGFCLSLASLYALYDQPKSALIYYHRTLQLAPDWVEAHLQLGKFFLNTHAFAHAATQMKNVLALDPDHLMACFHLGICHFQLGAFEAAQQCFETVITRDPTQVEAWVNLGALALKCNDDQKAIDHFTKALTLDVNHETARANLAATFMHHLRHENALTHYLILLAQCPDHPEYLYNAAISEITLGQLQSARERLLRLLAMQPHQFTVLYNLAVIALRMGKKNDARQFFQRALAVHPEDANCQHLFAALTGGASDRHASEQHALQLFEQYAPYYDQHLLSTLSYQLPIMIHAYLEAHTTHQWGAVLDLGCGTGLCGERLRDHSQRLIGVDLSPHMLARAETKGCYDQLITQDICSYLEACNESFDLIIAADVLPYIGALERCFHALQHRLRSNGLFIFSVEPSTIIPWHLQETARYAHHEGYIEDLCAQTQLAILSKETKVSRSQAGTPLTVYLYVIGRLG